MAHANTVDHDEGGLCHALVGAVAAAAGVVDGIIAACVDVGWRPVVGIRWQRATFKVTLPTLNRFTYGQSL
jgi:hypothetical protein